MFEFWGGVIGRLGFRDRRDISLFEVFGVDEIVVFFAGRGDFSVCRLG